MMGRVVHFEFFAAEPAAAADFFRGVLDWDIQTWGGPMEYWLAGTGPRNEPGIDGAIAPLGELFDQRVVVTAAVDDVDATIEAVVAAGGRAITGKQPIAGVGWQASLVDPRGLVFGVMQEDPDAGS